MRILASSLILVGSVFALIAGWGQLRFRDVYVRIHVATKPATLGLALVLLGALIRADGIAPSAKLGLAIALQFVTAPVAGSKTCAWRPEATSTRCPLIQCGIMAGPAVTGARAAMFSNPLRRQRAAPCRVHR